MSGIETEKGDTEGYVPFVKIAVQHQPSATAFNCLIRDIRMVHVVRDSHDHARWSAFGRVPQAH